MGEDREEGEMVDQKGYVDTVVERIEEVEMGDESEHWMKGSVNATGGIHALEKALEIEVQPTCACSTECGQYSWSSPLKEH